MKYGSFVKEWKRNQKLSFQEVNNKCLRTCRIFYKVKILPTHLDRVQSKLSEIVTSDDKLHYYFFNISNIVERGVTKSKFMIQIKIYNEFFLCYVLGDTNKE